MLAQDHLPGLWTREAARLHVVGGGADGEGDGERVPLFSRLLSFMPTSPHLSVSLSDDICQLFVGAREHGHRHSPRAPRATAPLNWPATGEWLPLLISGFCVFDGMTFGWVGGALQLG